MGEGLTRRQREGVVGSCRIGQGEDGRRRGQKIRVNVTIMCRQKTQLVSAVQCSAVLYSTVQCSAVQCDTVQCCTVQ